VGIGVEHGGPLEWPQLGANADTREIVEDCLGNIRVGGVAVELAGVKAARITRFCEQLLGLGGIVYRGLRRLPVKLEGFGNNASGDFRIAERDCVVNALAINRQARSPPNPFVTPLRFRIPLIGK
jgi:hypothetical protein